MGITNFKTRSKTLLFALKCFITVFCCFLVPTLQAQPASGIHVVLAVSNVLCNGNNDGNASFFLVSGATPITVTWNKNGGGSGAGSLDNNTPSVSFSNLAPGNYTFTLTDANGADSTILSSITEPPALQGNLQVLTNYQGYDVACTGKPNGGAALSASGGTPPYKYVWPSNETGPVADSLPAGASTALLIDANYCTLPFPMNLSAPPAMTTTLDLQGEKCYGENTGSVTLQQISGGLPPYAVAFNGGSFQQNVTNWDNLAPGSYFLEVRDANGCIKTEGIVLPSGLEFKFFAGPDLDIFSGDTAVVSLTSPHQIDTFLAAPFASSFSGGNQLLLFPQFSTTFTVMATDDIGCGAEDEVRITVHRNRSVFAPNVFAAEASDPDNRFFTLFANGGVRQIARLQIYDRQSRLVFEKTNFPAGVPATGWDGSDGTRMASAGVFFWVATVEYTDGRLEQMQGDVTLIR